MSDHAVKCPVGATMQCVCALYLCAAVMADPGMLHFTSLAQDTYMSLLFRSTSNIHELEWFQWQEILSSFWCPSTKNTSDKPEHSSVKINLKFPTFGAAWGNLSVQEPVLVFSFVISFSLQLFPCCVWEGLLLDWQVQHVHECLILLSASLHLGCIENLAATRFKVFFSAWG